MSRRAGLARSAATLTAVALVVAAAACTQAGDDAGPSPAPSEATSTLAVSAVALRLREDEAVGGRFQVKVTNAGLQPVHVTAVAVESPALAAAPATPRDTVLRPGARVDLPVRHGPAVCAPSADPGDAVAVLTLEHDGRERQVRLPLGGTQQSRAVLARIHDESCTARRVAGVLSASLAVGRPTADATGLVLPAAVVLERPGSPAATPAVRALAVGGSVLYGLTAAPGALPVTLAPGAARGQVPVTVRSTSCSGHVLGEAKKPFDLGVWISLDGGPEQWTLVRTTPEVRAALRSYLRQACGLS